MIRARIASSSAAQRQPPSPHPRLTLQRTALRPLPRSLWRTRCAACGETAYGSTALRSEAALAESSCLPVEANWNDALYGYVPTASSGQDPAGGMK